MLTMIIACAYSKFTSESMIVNDATLIPFNTFVNTYVVPVQREIHFNSDSSR